jgi:hypothetical protein
MKGWVACAFIVATMSLAAQAQMAKMAISSEEDYSKAMKEVGMQNGVLRKSIASSSEADAAAAASRLETIFKDVQAYWRLPQCRPFPKEWRRTIWRRLARPTRRSGPSACRATRRTAISCPMAVSR